eukprot:gene21178-2718_t
MDFEKYGGKKKKKEKKKPQRSERSIFDPGGGAPSVHSAGSPAVGAGDTATAVQLHPPSSGSGVAHAGSSARQSGFPQSGKLRGSHMGAAAPSPKPRPQQWDAANTYRHSSLRTQRHVDHRGHKYNQHNQNYVAQRDFEKSEVGLIKGVCEALNVGSLREIAIEKKFRGSGERYVCFDHIDEFRKVQRLVQRAIVQDFKDQGAVKTFEDLQIGPLLEQLE